MSVWREMLQGDNGAGSAANAGFLLAVVTLCVCTLYAGIHGSETAFLGIAGILAAQTGGTKTWSKVSDNSVKKAAMGPSETTINIPGGAVPENNVQSPKG